MKNIFKNQKLIRNLKFLKSNNRLTFIQTSFFMKILPLKAVYPNLNQIPISNDFFDSVKFRYREYASQNMFEATHQDAIYIYQIKDRNMRKFTGLITCTDISDYFEDRMKKHEKTIISNEKTQSELLHLRGAAIKPVLLTYPSVSELNELIYKYLDTHKKFYVMELAGEKHRFWQITEPEIIEQIQVIFEKKIPVTYIADGHHRSASFAALHQKIQSEKTQKMLTAYFPVEELAIREQNRLVTDLNGLSPDAFLEKLRDYFKIKVLKKGVKPYAKLEMTMFLDNRWFQLNWRKSEIKGFAEGLVLLDVHLLNEKILKPILGIKNIRVDKRIKYIEGSKSINEIEQTVASLATQTRPKASSTVPNCPVVFCMFPVEFEDLKQVADSGGVMPPKSTFFEPRMKNGLLVYEID